MLRHPQNPEAHTRRWYALHLLTWLAVFVVGASFVFNNLILLGPFRFDEGDGGTDFNWTVSRKVNGWPFGYRNEWHYREYSHGDLSSSAESSEGPTADLQNLRTLALLGDTAIGIVIILATGVAVEHWIRHGHRRFQFSLTTLMALTAIAAFIVAALKHEGVDWKLLLYVPVCFGIGCCAYLVGVWLASTASKSDARLTRLRKRFQRL